MELGSVGSVGSLVLFSVYRSFLDGWLCPVNESGKLPSQIAVEDWYGSTRCLAVPC
jgi:hypothetical protein